jgi:hypothetical protein
VGFAEGERDGVEFARAFVEEVAEVGGGSVGGADGQVHVRQLYWEFALEANWRTEAERAWRVLKREAPLLTMASRVGPVTS